MSSALWVKRVKVETEKYQRVTELINKIAPTPFEERRSRVGTVTYKTWRRIRFAPAIVFPMCIIGGISEMRDLPHENIFTGLHLWLADNGVFRHDTVRALNPAFEDERRSVEYKSNDRKWRFTGADLPSEREIKEFAAINLEKQRRAKQKE
jgi:hypothetical protein